MPTAKAPESALLDALEAQGFDACTPGDGTATVGCSQCAALVINGTATHERGCPHQTGECIECGAIVPRNVRTCEDCHNGHA